MRDELNAHRDTLKLELAILSEHKIAKVIKLLEELRRDSPQVQDRVDPQAQQIADPADAGSVLAAVRETDQPQDRRAGEQTPELLCSWRSRPTSGSFRNKRMHIRYGYDIALELGQPATILAMADVHSDFRGHIIEELELEVAPPSRPSALSMTMETLSDDCRPGRACHCVFRASFDADGREDEVDSSAEAAGVSDLPADTPPFLRASRYCETDLLSDFAWANFGAVRGGWARVQAVCDSVHQRLRFSYPEARPTRTASEALAEGVGVCRDFTHLAVALCRCLNIPARYCNGYLGDIGVPPDPAPMDFNAWFEAFLGDRWFTFDARHNQPRIGRILIARGRDAADIPMITTFGSDALTRFTVVTEGSWSPHPSRLDRQFKHGGGRSASVRRRGAAISRPIDCAAGFAERILEHSQGIGVSKTFSKPRRQLTRKALFAAAAVAALSSASAMAQNTSPNTLNDKMNTPTTHAGAMERTRLPPFGRPRLKPRTCRVKARASSRCRTPTC